jgi:OOP family OmpA-OmpF porin
MKHVLIFAAFTASAASAQPDYVTAAGEAVKTGYGEPWQVASAPRPQRAPLSAAVLFDFDGAELRAEGRQALDELAQRYFAGEAERVVAVAHADRLGDAEYNVGLSARRANAVRDYLVEQGVLPSVIAVDVAGAGRPVSACAAMGEERRDNAKLVACLQPDRRVEVEAAR